MFNPNQKVKCVSHEGARPALREGTIYTVAHHFNANELADHRGRESGGVMLLGHVNPRTGQLIRPPHFYKADRFVAVEENGVATQTPATTPEPAQALGQEIRTESMNALIGRLSELETKVNDHIEDDSIHC